MDKKTFKKLEFDKIQDILAGYTHFEGGYQKVYEAMPSSNYELVTKRLDETQEAMEVLRFSEPSFLHGLKLINQHFAKARVKGLLSPAELRDIYHLLNSSRMARKHLSSNPNYPQLRKLCFSLTEIYDLENKINKAISEEGEVRDDASDALKSIRNQINSIRLRIREYLQNFIRSENNQKMLQDVLVTERDGRYVVPVKQEYRNDVKGIIHDESASGATVFIEPLPVVEQNNRIRALQLEEKREVERILRQLSDEVSVYTDELATNLDILGSLDFIFARAQMAYKTNSYRPDINTAGIIDIDKGRHPLLGENAVPLKVQLGKDFDILVITGPNTGGKTVSLKTIGLLSLMTMCGLFIPARENSRIALFESIYVDIGDEQSIEQSLSTFSSHMTNIISILKKVDEKSLVIMDELGAGTDPAEGAALARVILEELQRKKAKVVVSTHQSELKNFAYQRERVENACVEFDPVSLKPTYKLTIGMPGQSNAFEIAARLGLDSELVQRAREIVPENEAEIGNMIRKLKESRHYFDMSSKEVETLKVELQNEREALREERESFHREKAELMEKAVKEADEYVRKIKNEANDAIDELRELLKNKEEPPKWHEIEKSRRKLKQVNTSKMQALEPEDESPRKIKAGDYVYVKSLNQKGYVLEESNKQGEVIVQAGILKLTVKERDLKLTESPEEKQVKIRNNTFLEKAKHISKEIDLRGKLAEDALLEVDKYLEDANLVGLDSVRIIHGKGTGALRKAVREYLRDHRYVQSFRDGLREEGGFGVTVVELK